MSINNSYIIYSTCTQSEAAALLIVTAVKTQEEKSRTKNCVDKSSTWRYQYRSP